MKVLIGDEGFEQEYAIVKHCTLEEVLDLLSPAAKETTPLKMEIRVEQVKSEVDDGETYNSESPLYVPVPYPPMPPRALGVSDARGGGLLPP